jgi:hypothetical protein
VAEHESKLVDKILPRFVLKTGDFFIVHSMEDELAILSMFPEARVRKAYHPTYDVFNSGYFDPDAVKKKYSIEGNIISNGCGSFRTTPKSFDIS